MSAITHFDAGLILKIQSLPAKIILPMRLASLLGEPLTIVAVAAFFGLLAYRDGHKDLAEAFIIAVAANGLCGILKLYIHRTRPDTIYVTHMRFKSYSFPSGHSFGSLVLYGLLIYLAFIHLPLAAALVCAVFGTLLIFAIGLSRVYLGAHFPSDVLGGWILGSVSLFIIIIFNF